MPVYEYKCKVCDDRFDIEQQISDDTLATLEGCTIADDGEHQLKKVFSSVGISFKGEGFYRNDARGTKSSNTPSPSSESTEGSDSSSGDSSSSSDSSSTSSSSSSSDSSSSSSSSSSTTKSSSGPSSDKSSSNGN